MTSFLLIGPKLWGLEADTQIDGHTDSPPFIIYIISETFTSEDEMAIMSTVHYTEENHDLFLFSCDDSYPGFVCPFVYLVAKQKKKNKITQNMKT